MICFEIFTQRLKRKRCWMPFPLLITLSLVFFVTHAVAQDSDDNFRQGGEVCKGNNPDNFQLSPAQGAPGSTFIIHGKTHDARYAGPGSSVALSWQELSSDPGYSFQVAGDGTFTGLIKVPAQFNEGPHVLIYEEATPYVACVQYTVTNDQPAPYPSVTFPELAPIAWFLSLFVKLLSFV